MKKSYLIIAIFGTILLLILFAILFFTKSNTLVTMTSIFIPILFGILIEYDNREKTIYKEYYEPLYHYIRVYQDVLSQPNKILDISKKHQMMSSIAKDMINFLNSNLKYVSEEVSDSLEFILFHQYNNNNNEFQDVYDINGIIPVIMNEIILNYNELYFNHYFKRKIYMKKEKPHKVNFMIYMYCNGFLLDIARKKEYVVSIGECVETYEYIDKWHSKNYKKYSNLYKFCKKNRKQNIDTLLKELKDKYNINIKKIKRNK